MADIINLRQARKQKARADKARVAQANRARFGMTKAEREKRDAEAHSLARTLEGHRREPDANGMTEDADGC